MIKYVKGDLLEAEENIICHGVNCRGGFGSGIAGQIAKKYPLVKEEYLNKFENKGWKLGEVQYVYKYPDKIFINCSTQYNYGYNGELNADYDAIKTCMQKVKNFASRLNYSIAIPKIGCGLAGGDWNIVEKILIDIFIDYDIMIFEL